MSARFAGDYFGISQADLSDTSELLNYFPELRDTYKRIKTDKDKEEGPKITGNFAAPVGFSRR